MRKLMMTVAALAGVAVVTGCQRSEVQDERQDVAEARQELREERQELAEARREQMPQQAQAGAMMVQGNVRAAEPDTLVLVVPAQGNREMRLKADEQTRVMQDNRPVQLQDIQEGARVRTSYVTEGNELLAREVIVLVPLSPQGQQQNP